MKRRAIKFEDRVLVYSKCNYRCAKCGSSIMVFNNGATIDHIVPVSKGGTNDTRNLVSMCKACNIAKGDNLVVPRLYYPYLEDSVIHNAENYFLENVSIFNNYNTFWNLFLDSLEL